MDTPKALTPDDALLEAWRDGDGSAGTLLLGRYRIEILRFFRKRAPTQAEELTQRTLEALVRCHASFRGDSSFRRYTFGIARKMLLKHYAEAARSCDRLEPDTWSSREGATAAGRAVVRTEVQQTVAGALAELPGDLGRTLWLHYFDGLTMDELATFHDTKPGTIKSRLFRGRALLRTRLLQVAPRADLLAVAPDCGESW